MDRKQEIKGRLNKAEVICIETGIHSERYAEVYDKPCLTIRECEVCMETYAKEREAAAIKEAFDEFRKTGFPVAQERIDQFLKNYLK